MLQKLGRQVGSWMFPTFLIQGYNKIKSLSPVSRNTCMQPSSSECWYIKVSIGDSSSAAGLRIKVGIPLEPEDLNGRRSLSSLILHSVWIDDDVVHGCVYLGCCLCLPSCGIAG